MIFDNVSFNVNDFHGSLVDGKTLYIYTAKRTFDVEYTSNANALLALSRLEEAVQEAQKTTSTSNTFGSLLDALGTVSNAAQKAAGKVKNKVQSNSSLAYAMTSDAVVDALKAKAGKMVDDLEGTLGTVTAHLSSKVLNSTKDIEEQVNSTLETVKENINTVFNEIMNHDDATVDSTPAKPSTESKSKGTRIFTEDAFSGVKEDEKAQPTLFSTDEPLIGDMTSTELRKAIGDFVDSSLQNERVQELFKSINAIFGKDDVQEAVDALKTMIYDTAVQNPDVKLSDILHKFFG